eukprot:SAG22_NODE_6071_length_905_cov_1.468983_2_plen_57_part_01
MLTWTDFEEQLPQEGQPPAAADAEGAKDVDGGGGEEGAAKEGGQDDTKAADADTERE